MTDEIAEMQKRLQDHEATVSYALKLQEQLAAKDAEIATLHAENASLIEWGARVWDFMEKSRMLPVLMAAAPYSIRTGTRPKPMT